MEQTRPCLPAYYRERGYRRPGRHFPASERALPHHSNHYEEPLAAYPGHVISAIRTSVPLHRSEEQPWAGRNSSQGGRAALRGSRHSQGPRHSAKPDKRSRSRNPIGPGKYGYGKVPYILPLQTDTGQQPQKLRRQRQSSRSHLFQQSPSVMSSYSQAAAPSLQHGNLYQEPAGLQAGHQGLGPSVYQSPSFPVSQSLFHGGDSSPQALQGQPQPQRAAAIVCIGAYKQYKLCNTNWQGVACSGFAWPGFGRGEGWGDCRCGFHEKLPEASTVSNRESNASWLRMDPELAKAKPSRGGSTIPVISYFRRKKSSCTGVM
ncbi:thrombospondin type-1 domain-containing protein 4-like protein [Turdus rufiventris]|nr:thrombospondin type-1 domain-containing protein 4-like protein [Turdus rufiventris]